MPPRNRRTVIIKTGNFPSALSSADIVERITNHLEISSVEAVQILPGKQARITFKNVESKTLYESVGEMTFGEIVCPVYVPKYTSQVMVFLYPFEGENEKVGQALSPFGTVQEVRHQHWANLEGVATGTRLVKIIRKGHIPRFVHIDGFKCKVWYKDQPLECDICHQGHKASACPLKGKCLRCRQDGHFRAQCPNPPWSLNVSAGSAQDASIVDSVAPSSDDGPIANNTSSMDVDEVAPALVNVCGVSVPVVPPPNAFLEVEDVDERDNQLDELSNDSQPASQSVLAGLSVVAPSTAVERLEDDPSQVIPPSDVSNVLPAVGPASRPSASPVDPLVVVAEVSPDIVVSGPPVVASDSSVDSLANLSVVSAPPVPCVQESSVSELVVEDHGSSVVASVSSGDSLANVPDPSVLPVPCVRECSGSGSDWVVEVVGTSEDFSATSSDSSREPSGPLSEFVPPLPPRDRPSRRSFQVSGSVLESSRSRSRTRRQSESPSPTGHRLPHVASATPVRKKK